jgi:solute:Na+ symporter, SSS family
VGGFARLGADLVMRGDADAVTKLKDRSLPRRHHLGPIQRRHRPHQGHAQRPVRFWNIHWLYYCEGLFVLTAALMVIISLMTKAPDPKTVKYTWYGATPEEKAATRASWNAPWTWC